MGLLSYIHKNLVSIKLIEMWSRDNCVLSYRFTSTWLVSFESWLISDARLANKYNIFDLISMFFSLMLIISHLVTVLRKPRSTNAVMCARGRVRACVCVCMCFGIGVDKRNCNWIFSYTVSTIVKVQSWLIAFDCVEIYSYAFDSRQFEVRKYVNSFQIFNWIAI